MTPDEVAREIIATLPAVDPAIVSSIVAAVSAHKRARHSQAVHAGLTRARAAGHRLGRPRTHVLPASVPAGLTVRGAAREWGVSKSTAARWLVARRLPPSVHLVPERRDEFVVVFDGTAQSPWGRYLGPLESA